MTNVRKMLESKRLWLTSLAAACVMLSVAAVQRVRSEANVDALLKATPETRHGYDVKKEPARKARAWKLYQLWLERNERDVAPEIVPFLQDEYWIIRQNAARVLGRLESPVAEAQLQRMLTAVEQGKANKENRLRVRPDVLKLALGRIRSRELRAQAKLAAVVSSVGLSLGDLGRLTAKRRAAAASANDSPAEKTMTEIVDVLYQMAKRGENIESLAKPLTLYPAQRVRLQGAELPPDDEAKLYVDYLTQLNTLTVTDGELAEFHLVSLGSAAIEMLVKQLQAIEEERISYGRRGYSGLFDAAALTGDPRLYALLKKLEKKPDGGVRGYARMAREDMERRGNWESPLSPASPFMFYPPQL